MEGIKKELEKYENQLKRYRETVKHKIYILKYNLRLEVDDCRALYRDKEFVLQVMEYNTEIYRQLDMVLKKDIDIAVKAFSVNSLVVPQGLFKNNEFLNRVFKDMNTSNFKSYNMLINSNPDNFDLVPYNLKQNKEIILHLIGTNIIKLIPKIDYVFHDDYDIIFKAVVYDPECIEYASLRLRDNKDIIMKIISKDIKLLRYASKRILEEFSYVIDSELFSRNNKWLEEVE